MSISNGSKWKRKKRNDAEGGIELDEYTNRAVEEDICLDEEPFTTKRAHSTLTGAKRDLYQHVEQYSLSSHSRIQF